MFGDRKLSRLAIGVALTVAIIVAVVIGAKTVLPKFNNSRSMCAEFTDAVGLYPGNKVALLGIEIGKTTAIVNKPQHVEVDFTVPKDLDLPADVGAITYSQSVVTDRHVELTKPYTGGPKFEGPQCIPLQNTRTPMSVSESLSAVGKLADTIMATEPGQDPSRAPGVQAINDSLNAASRSLEGTGLGLNQALRDLVTMLGDPYKADADYRQLFENSEVLSSEFLKHWEPFATVVKALPASTQLIEGLSDGFAATLSQLSHLLPFAVEAVNRIAPRVFHNLGDKLVPFITDLLNAYTPHIVGIINWLAPATHWLGDIYEPAWGTHNVTYLPPQVAISPSQAGAICDVLRQRNVPGATAACAPGTSADPVTLGLTDLILGAALS